MNKRIKNTIFLLAMFFVAALEAKAAQVETPVITFDNTNNKVTIACATDGATIYYNTGDGTQVAPTSASTLYETAFSVTAPTTVKAIAIKDGMDDSEVAVLNIEKVATPTIIRNGDNVTMGCSYPTGAVIHYTTDGNNPTSSSSVYNSPIVLSNLPVTIKAIAIADNYSSSDIVTRDCNTLPGNLQGDGTAGSPYKIASVDDYDVFVSMASGAGSSNCYKLMNSITLTGNSSVTGTFSGTFEAAIDDNTKMPYRISGLSQPMFTTLTGTVKNLVLENVNITSGTNVGAIAYNVQGTSTNLATIYNCGILSGSIGGTGHVGGLVGDLGVSGNNDNCYARVINCYSFANITGGSVKAGIVGYNNYASIYTDIRAMVMNCMFYGDISTGGTISPIYGGEIISNDYKSSADGNADPNYRLNNYNYYLYEAPFSKNNTTTNPIISKYNCALAAEERFLVRFEFYRHLLNSTRELAAWYATGSADQSAMLKWVLDKSIASYPILKVQGTYPSVVNYDAESGTSLGTLTVNISVGTGGPEGASIKQGKTQITLTRTGKDPNNYNFNYDKVQLPYYNEVGTKNYTAYKVVTGWKITGMGGSGTSGGYTENNYDYPNYNYADRNTYGKDIYTSGTGNSGRVFAQGAYFNVPTGVTSINIEPYWGKAAYLSDACYDRYGYNTTDDLTQVGGGQRYVGGTSTITVDGSSQTVYTTVATALEALTGVTTPTVYDYAVVLVGNYHHHAEEGRNGPELSSGDKPFTIMSIDLNLDNEPDYCLIYRSGKNKPISPIRFDFITVPGMVMAHKMASNGDLGIPGNCTPMGWFEITTTALIKYGQFEHSYNGKTLAPVIFMGGVIDQFVANNTSEAADAVTQTKYMLFGDNVWFKMFSNGCHMDKFFAPPRRPISITGGEYEAFYLSGYFRPDAKPAAENAECYIDGGKFGEVAGAGHEHVYGDVKWLINHADINSFYGGGINAAKPVTGNIETTIDNSWIDFFCGGPKFGDMLETGPYTIIYAKNKAGTSTGTITVNVDSDRTVTSSANNTVFGTYFGAGYGGTSIYRECPSAYNQFTEKNYDFNSWVAGSYDKSGGNGFRGKITQGKGVASGYEYELFGGSAGNVGRLYLEYASFSLAQTNDVTSTLTGCTVTGSFYGGGSLGKVVGSVTSMLNGCTVKGSVFGAGFSATIPSASILATGGFTLNGIPTNPNYNETTGVYEKADYPDPTDYKWTHVQSLTNYSQTLTDADHTIKTTEALDALGTVSGKVTLILTGKTTVEGWTFKADGTPDVQTGGVFGGGDESDVTASDTGTGNAVTKAVTVNINTTSTDPTKEYINNVFGGGNKADVSNGSTEVILSGSSYVKGNVYGGGNEGAVGGDSSVTIQDP